MTPYGDKDLGLNIGSAITWTNDDQSSVISSYIYLMAISQGINQ